MEKTLKPNNDKEYMRMAMLKHEETFREQVNELHRLYRIQKMLMESVGQQQQQTKHQKLDGCNNILESSKRPLTIDHYQQQLLLQAQRDHISATNLNVNTKINNNISIGLNLIRSDNQALPSGPPRLPSDGQEHIGESNINGKIMMLDESEIELTLSLGPSCMNNPRRKKSGKSCESGDQSISSSSTGSSQTRKRSPKNDDNNSTTTWASFSHQSGSGMEPGFSNGQNGNPPWLYQALSLKLT